MIVAESVHNDMCSWTAVIDITEDVQLVYDKPLDNVTDCNNETVGTASRDNSANDSADVITLVLVIGTLVEQFLNNV